MFQRKRRQQNCRRVLLYIFYEITEIQMNPFTRRDLLTDTAAQTLNKIQNQTLTEALVESTYNTNHRSALDDRALFYVEKPENMQVINAFIKRFLSGTHLDPIDRINRLFIQLQTIGLHVDDGDNNFMLNSNIDGTFDVFQYGRMPSDHPISGSEYIDDEIFLRSRMHGKMKIKTYLVPGGLYMIDAELYITPKGHK